VLIFRANSNYLTNLPPPKGEMMPHKKGKLGHGIAHAATGAEYRSRNRSLPFNRPHCAGVSDAVSYEAMVHDPDDPASDTMMNQTKETSAERLVFQPCDLHGPNSQGFSLLPSVAWAAIGRFAPFRRFRGLTFVV
jgi:hypothetical protein